MTEFPETHSEVLVRIQSPEDREAWETFASLYRPVIYRMARRHGLQDADAQDLVQRVLVAVAGSISRWEKRKGIRFRHWLRRVTKNAVSNALSRRPKDVGGGGTDVQDLLNNQPLQDSDRDFTLERRREIFHQAAVIVKSEVRYNTWRAFELTVIDGQPVGEAASSLGVSAGGIYAAQGRVINRLKRIVAEIEREEA